MEVHDQLRVTNTHLHQSLRSCVRACMRACMCVTLKSAHGVGRAICCFMGESSHLLSEQPDQQTKARENPGLAAVCHLHKVAATNSEVELGSAMYPGLVPFVLLGRITAESQVSVEHRNAAWPIKVTALTRSPDWQILELPGKMKTPEVHGKLSDHNKAACVEPLTQNSSLESRGGTTSLLLTALKQHPNGGRRRGSLSCLSPPNSLHGKLTSRKHRLRNTRP